MILPTWWLHDYASYEDLEKVFRNDEKGVPCLQELVVLLKEQMPTLERVHFQIAFRGSDDYDFYLHELIIGVRRVSFSEEIEMTLLFDE